jgi:opacity protein-like surface antigen
MHSPRIVRIVLLAGVALVALAGRAGAQGFAPAPALPAFGLGVHGGVFDPKDGDTDGFGGAHARLRLLPFLGVEVSADVREADFRDDVKILQVPVQLSALLYLIPQGPFQPYVGGGVGWYYLHIDPEGASSRTTEEFGYHAGAGVDIPLNPSWVLNADFRYYALADKVEGRELRDIEADGWQVRAVKAAQQALKDKGHDPGPIDGKMGPKTPAALKAFQKGEGLPETGRLDSATRGKLGV